MWIRERKYPEASGRVQSRKRNELIRARVICKRRQQPGVGGGRGKLALIKDIWEKRSLGREKGQDAGILL